MTDVIMLGGIHRGTVWTLGTSGEVGRQLGVGSKAWPEPRAGRLWPKLLLLGCQGRKHLPVPRWVGAEDLES